RLEPIPKVFPKFPILARISHQAAWNTGKALVFWSEARMIKNTVCYSYRPIMVQASLLLHEIVGCALCAP
ncbi:MAG: hypothetical protein WBO16_07240, partial [Gammaproteobacteria bacterium]